MVTKGQLLERPVIVPAGPVCLDGIYLRGGGPSLLLASPLPGRGGSMVNTVGTELAYAAAYAGCASLRLDYRGVGASEGEESADPVQAAADLQPGVDFLLESTRTDLVAVASYLSGSWAALCLAREDPRVDRLLLVSPPWEDPPPGVPAFGEVEAPIFIVVGGNDPGYNVAQAGELVDAALNTRLEVMPNTDETFREQLVALARRIPRFLCVDPPDKVSSTDRG